MMLDVRWTPAVIALLAAITLGCDAPVAAGGSPTQGASDIDTLAVPDGAEPGSLDDLHRRILLRSCAGQAGLCHNGQFEPNLSTPAQAYENLVRGQSTERREKELVAPGAPEKSLLIDKLRNKNVISRMPLGAEPLAEDEIAAIEAWIADGALRRPGASVAPALNHPPREPELAVFDAAGARLDGAGPVSVKAGDALTFRQSVDDFETSDDKVLYAGFTLSTADGRQALVDPTLGDQGYAGYAYYEGDSAPMGKGDRLSWRFDYTIPSMIKMIDAGGATVEVPTAGLSLTPLAFYADQALDKDGMITFSFVADLVQVQP